MNPQLYKLAPNKKLQSIVSLYGRVPYGIDLTKLTFRKSMWRFVDFKLVESRGDVCMRCVEFEWVFIAASDEFIKFNPLRHVKRHKRPQK